MANDKLRGIVYSITNLVNGMQYVGQTTQPLARRLKDHFVPSKSGKTYIGRAIKKYGKENFKSEIISGNIDVDSLDHLEQHFIYEMKTLSPNGYNLTTGGERFNHTEETKKKISEKLKGKSTWNLGIEMPEYQKERISKANKGKKNTKETIIKMRKARPNKRAIINQDGKRFESLADAARKLSLNISSIHRVLNGKRKTTGGYSFKYLGDE